MATTPGHPERAISNREGETDGVKNHHERFTISADIEGATTEHPSKDIGNREGVTNSGKNIKEEIAANKELNTGIYIGEEAVNGSKDEKGHLGWSVRGQEIATNNSANHLETDIQDSNDTTTSHGREGREKFKGSAGGVHKDWHEEDVYEEGDEYWDGRPRG